LLLVYKPCFRGDGFGLADGSMMPGRLPALESDATRRSTESHNAGRSALHRHLLLTALRANIRNTLFEPLHQ